MDLTAIIGAVRGCIKPEEFAVLLGFRQSHQFPTGYARYELERLQMVLACFTRNTRESEQQQHMIYARFCALYLPDTVSRYLDLPTLHPEDLADQDFATHYKLYNAYLEILVRVQHAPYFVKYFLSNKPLAAPGKRLPSVLAQRLLDLAPYLDRRMRSSNTQHPTVFYRCLASNCTRLLNTLLTIFVKVPDRNTIIPAATQRGLLTWLELWVRRYQSPRSSESEDVVGEAFWLLWAQLSPEMNVKKSIKIFLRQLKNADHCALPSCAVKDNCRVCAKCKTARYCSVEHQRAHWNLQGVDAHKHVCIETQY